MGEDRLTFAFDRPGGELRLRQVEFEKNGEIPSLLSGYISNSINWL